MAARLVIAPEALIDIDEAFDWYERQKRGLGDEFLKELRENIRAIRKSPKIHACVHQSFRRRLLRRFPYAIFFEYEQSTVIVYCIFHTSRNPNIWKSRLP